MPLLLTESDDQCVLPMADLILAMESALVRFSSDQVAQPLRNGLEVGSEKSFFGVMPAYIPGSSALGVKVVGVFDGNAKRGLAPSENTDIPICGGPKRQSIQKRVTGQTLRPTRSQNNP